MREQWGSEPVTEAVYLADEVRSPTRREYVGGFPYAMAGASNAHNLIAGNVFGTLHHRLRGGPCRPYNSDLRVRTPSGLTTYPDVTVICGPRELDAVDPLAITNPALIVEVLSRSTEEYDSGDKFEHYKTFPTLREYVLVSHRERGRLVAGRRLPRRRARWTTPSPPRRSGRRSPVGLCANSLSAGTSVRHRSRASAQRGWNAQPCGM